MSDQRLIAIAIFALAFATIAAEFIKKDVSVNGYLNTKTDVSGYLSTSVSGELKTDAYVTGGW